MSWCDMQAGLAMLWSSLWKQTYFKIEIKLMKSSTINDRYKKKTTEAPRTSLATKKQKQKKKRKEKK